MKTSLPRITIVNIVFVLLAACGDDMPPPPPVDSGGGDTATDSSADTSMDGSADSTVSDGGTDSTVADGGADASDTSIDTGRGCIATDRCSCSMDGIDCAGGCPTGTTCIDNSCGELFCLPAGGKCNTDADCPDTSTCVDIMGAYACVRSSPGCADSRECPRGFACESDTCVDRRVPCVNNVDCPWGYACQVSLDSHGSFCEYIARSCNARAACTSLGACRDYDGDGDTECGGNGTCPMTACGGTDACGTDPTTVRASCGDYGPCQTTCNAGFSCVDSWGDGQGECVPAGTCTTNVECPERQVCAPPNGGGPPACQMGNDPS